MPVNHDLPFSQWRLRPQQGEPSYGYFARLVADEGHSSLKIYATEIGINGRNPVPEEMLHVLQQLPLTAEEHERLRRATPLAVDSFHQIGSERLRPKQLSYRRRRFCPHCLADAPYHRIQWDVVAASHCPIHGTRLISEVGGKPLKWWWPHFDVSPDGDELIDRTAAAPDRPLPFHEMLRSRLEFGQREEGWTAAHNLYDLIEASVFYARFRCDGKPAKAKSNSAPDIEAGFAVVSAAHGERVDWFSAWYETVIPADVRRRGFEVSTGWSFMPREATYRATNPLWDALETAQYEGFARVGTLSRKFSNHDPARTDRTLREAAEELGLPPKGLGPFIKSLNLLPNSKWNGDAHSIDSATFDKIRALVDDLITLPQTKVITGISGTEFRRLAKAGYIREFKHMPVGGLAGPRYLASEVRALVERFRSMTARQPTKGMQSIQTYCRARGLNIGDLLVATMSSSLSLSAVDLSRTGLRGLHYVPN
ncbi:hypothetical protein HFO43_09555 [Rhizobium leguminosarum]|uniref:TniQ family protein n=1 Tax=Rhizobium leguminosarum TaxID=384 RepID=UPI001C9390D0|nr:TniQ family protein [Rhizobium leguminosarum]MBY5668788.1 hypothetical protein [Rhizobium leguminosarum]